MHITAYYIVHNKTNWRYCNFFDKLLINNALHLHLSDAFIKSKSGIKAILLGVNTIFNIKCQVYFTTKLGSKLEKKIINNNKKWMFEHHYTFSL